ncbi:MAG TPA: nitroreductase family deazaflavin-dependent oxidoreductase [Ktedonobacterales bacterium]|nr:nitroreductase family deazaflavin-dependent oxidoreductase [Ktedonobacterales bacterium]
MAKTYRVTFAVRASNWLVARLLRAGVKMGPKGFPMVLLTVRGRKSGQPRTVPVVMTEQDGQRYLIGTFGDVNWVRNLRAAGAATLARGRRAESVAAVELPTAEAARVLKRVVSIAPGFIRGYFDVTSQSSLEEFEREAPRHPVFRVQPLAQPARDAARDTANSGAL